MNKFDENAFHYAGYFIQVIFKLFESFKWGFFNYFSTPWLKSHYYKQYCLLFTLHLEEHVHSWKNMFQVTVASTTKHSLIRPLNMKQIRKKHILILKYPFSWAAFEPSRSSQIKYFQVNSADRGIQEGPNLFDRIAQSIQRVASS